MHLLISYLQQSNEHGHYQDFGQEVINICISIPHLISFRKELSFILIILWHGTVRPTLRASECNFLVLSVRKMTSLTITSTVSLFLYVAISELLVMLPRNRRPFLVSWGAKTLLHLCLILALAIAGCLLIFRHALPHWILHPMQRIYQPHTLNLIIKDTMLHIRSPNIPVSGSTRGNVHPNWHSFTSCSKLLQVTSSPSLHPHSPCTTLSGN